MTAYQAFFADYNQEVINTYNKPKNGLFWTDFLVSRENLANTHIFD